MALRKGQFLVISAIIVSLIVLSVSSTISEVNSREYESDKTAYTLQMIKQEASKVDMSSRKERENFQELLEMIDTYSVRSSYWSANQCFNVTLVQPGEQYQLNCIN